jgi:hypothetical protein
MRCSRERQDVTLPVAHLRVVERLEQLVQVALDPAWHLEHGCLHGDVLGVTVKLGQPPPDRDHRVLLDVPRRQCRVQRPPLVVSAHLDHELDRARVIVIGQLDAGLARRDTADPR